MIRLLIFDLDGTLVDTSRDIADALNYALEPVKVRRFSVEEVKAMVGSGISRLLETLIPPEIRKETPTIREEVIDRFVRYYSEHLLDNTDVYPGVKETLSELGDYKKAVVSNKREKFSIRVLEGLDILKFFDVVLGSDSVTEKKPSPVPMLEALKRTGVSRDEAIIIGDSNYDIESGRTAGIRTIAVTYGYRSKDLLKEADFMIDSFPELLTLLPRIDLIA